MDPSSSNNSRHAEASSSNNSRHSKASSELTEQIFKLAERITTYKKAIAENTLIFDRTKSITAEECKAGLPKMERNLEGLKMRRPMEIKNEIQKLARTIDSHNRFIAMNASFDPSALPSATSALCDEYKAALPGMEEALEQLKKRGDEFETQMKGGTDAADVEMEYEGRYE
jgi:predicted transcriptional regulator